MSANNIRPDYVEVLVFRKIGHRIQFLLLKRQSRDGVYPGVWQCVSGKRRSGERASLAARRELREETGFKPVRMWMLQNVNVFYLPKDDTVHASVTFAALVDRAAIVRLSREHEAAIWLSPSAARRKVMWNSVKKMMAEVHALDQGSSDIRQATSISYSTKG